MIILKIIGVLLLIIIMLVIAALCIPVVVGVTYDSSVSLIVKYLFIRYEYSTDKTEIKPQAAAVPSLWRRAKAKLWHGLKRAIAAVKKFVSNVGHRVKVGWKKLKLKLRPNKKKVKKKSSGGSNKTSKTKHSDKNLFQTLREEHGFWGTIGFFVDLGRLLGGTMVKIFRGVAANKFILHAKISSADPADTAVKYGKVCSFAFPALSFILGNMRRYEQDIVITPDFEGEGDRIFFEGEFVIFPIAVVGHALAAAVRFLFGYVKNKAI